MGSLQETSRHLSNICSKGGCLLITWEAYKTMAAGLTFVMQVSITAGPEE